MVEKKIKPRMHRRVPTSIQGTFIRAGTQEVTEIIEISIGGCLLGTKQPPDIGEEVTVTSKFGTDSEKAIAGKVIYLRDVEDDEKVFVRYVGVRYGDMSEELAAFLDQVVKSQRFRRFRKTEWKS